MLIWLSVELLMAMAGQSSTAEQEPRVILDAKDTATSLPQPPRVVGNPGSFFGVDSYPPDARRANQEGRIVVHLSVDATGKATDCTVYSGESPSLIARTCEIALSKVKFLPGRDASDKPVAGVTKLSVVWKLEGFDPVAVDSGPVEVFRSVMVIDVSSEGVATACRVVGWTGPQPQQCPSGTVGTKTPFATVGGKPVSSRVTVTTTNTLEAIKP